MNNLDLESYFEPFRKNIVGNLAEFDSPFGRQKLIYADWIASGRLYSPIEQVMQERFGPFVANTHSEASYSGRLMTNAYHEAHEIIKKHVNASDKDVILTTDSGTTGVLCKFQRILGLKLPEKFAHVKNKITESERPVVFLTHMEHPSNHTTWLETIADVVVLEPKEDLSVDVESLKKELTRYSNRKLKIGSFTACSNVSGVFTPFYELASVMHEHGGYCFVDFAASAPYVTIDMHPGDALKSLDAIFFSPHKFLGGPGSSGVLVFNGDLYNNRIPDHPGGGTVSWTNPWGEHAFFTDVEVREDGGTPAFLQTIRAALSIRLKEQMGIEKIRLREKELIEIAFSGLNKIPGIHILVAQHTDRLGVISFYSESIHFNLIVSLLSDLYGIQVRGGCSCAGTYGHMCLNVTREMSKKITDKIDSGDLSEKPGWVRLSLHPTMSNNELHFILKAIDFISKNAVELSKDYLYDGFTNEYHHKNQLNGQQEMDLFRLHSPVGYSII
ncbi:aminotransferase class V-fold PLP-dependent enzyme [Algoriphagus sp. D3-2-R+10]|uniref:aminotransferase class V-fold PLP-dependent enzyme n=1 Tax=Algoriphagus aurantiacus TaxID=3103948 RepID=UPI002B3663DE|nr:aminotransferase class V-fold PLP-dependent enzyme [Algoriphagus sp. D3-2-R+10]MEB2777416.1 aminotransferase class V-fold PLP-dependent enzyme [Algoriphagus sp. D3-2-R+10]